MGWETIGFSEVDPYCCKVLEKNFPGVKNYGDITKLDGGTITADIICGGPPCQPASIAGKRKGADDHRWLWPEALRLVCEIHPTWAVFENPLGLLSLDGGVEFERVLTTMEAEGYETQAVIIPACAVGAPHRRDRVWIIADTQSNGNTNGQECPRGAQFDEYDGWLAQSRLCGMDDELPERLDSNRLNFWETELTPSPLASSGKNRTNRLRAIGNSIVPQVAYQIFQAIQAAEDHQQ